MKKKFDVILGRDETPASKAFGCLCQSFDPDVLVVASTAFSRNDPGWQVVMNTRLSLPSDPSDALRVKKRWHDVSSSSSVGMLGVMMRVNLSFESMMRRILPPVPLDQ